MLMSMGFFCYSISDTLAKLLTATIDPLQIAWLRQVGLFCGIMVVFGIHGRIVLRSRKPGLQLARGLTAVVGPIAFIYALAHIPLADAVSITFVAPFMVTVLAAVLLREKVSAARWVAVVAGFAGAMVIIRPGMGVFHPTVVLALVASAAFAVRQILSRLLSGVDTIVTTFVYSGLTSSLVLILPLPFVWRWPQTGAELAMMLSIAVVAGLAEFLIIRALDMAQAAVVAPLQYTLIMWSTLWGFLIFSQIPDIWTWVGTAVVLVSGAWGFYLEAQRPGRKAPVAKKSQ